MKDKIQKAKQKIQNIRTEDAVATAGISVITIGFAALVILVVKSEEAQREQYQEEMARFKAWKKSELENGNVPVQLADGSFIAVPPQSLA